MARCYNTVIVLLEQGSILLMSALSSLPADYGISLEDRLQQLTEDFVREFNSSIVHYLVI